MSTFDPERREYGRLRVVCNCKHCTDLCRFMPSFLIPVDLGRMVPDDVDPLAWAEQHLLASPGAIVANSADGSLGRIRTLVLAVKEDRSCIFLRDGRCDIHAVAPFGCAFFGCGVRDETHLSLQGHHAVQVAWDTPGSLYSRIWEHLAARGLVAEPAEIKIARMKETLWYEAI